MTPLISVVIPTYNHCQFIGEAISSALNQTIDDFEIIVVDNFSTDDTERVVKSFQDPKRVLRTGYSQAKNSCQSESQASFRAALSIKGTRAFWVGALLKGRWRS